MEGANLYPEGLHLFYLSDFKAVKLFPFSL